MYNVVGKVSDMSLMQNRSEVIGLMKSEVHKWAQPKHSFLTITMILLQFLMVVSL